MVNVIHYARVLSYFFQLSYLTKKGEEEIAGITCFKTHNLYIVPLKIRRSSLSYSDEHAKKDGDPQEHNQVRSQGLPSCGTHLDVVTRWSSDFFPISLEIKCSTTKHRSILAPADGTVSPASSLP